MTFSYRFACQSPVEFKRAALVVGHPGHELRVFGWMSDCKPLVHVITDGSGRQGICRTPSTAALIANLGASAGELLGPISDAAIYRAMLQQDFPVFLSLVDVLASSFVKNHIDCVVGDAAEGFNPTHDLCRGLIDAAVLLAERTNDTEIVNFEVVLTEWEHGTHGFAHDDRCLHWVLDDRRLAEKIAAAEQYVELRDEVRRALNGHGKEYFRTECLRRSPAAKRLCFAGGKPEYEIWGEQRVVEGQYQTVIRFRQHILPILEAIREHALHAALDVSLPGGNRSRIVTAS